MNGFGYTGFTANSRGKSDPPGSAGPVTVERIGTGFHGFTVSSVVKSQGKESVGRCGSALAQGNEVHRYFYVDYTLKGAVIDRYHIKSARLKPAP